MVILKFQKYKALLVRLFLVINFFKSYSCQHKSTLNLVSSETCTFINSKLVEQSLQKEKINTILKIINEELDFDDSSLYEDIASEDESLFYDTVKNKYNFTEPDIKIIYDVFSKLIIPIDTKKNKCKKTQNSYNYSERINYVPSNISNSDQDELFITKTKGKNYYLPDKNKLNDLFTLIINFRKTHISQITKCPNHEQFGTCALIVNFLEVILQILKYQKLTVKVLRQLLDFQCDIYKLGFSNEYRSVVRGICDSRDLYQIFCFLEKFFLEKSLMSFLEKNDSKINNYVHTLYYSNGKNLANWYPFNILYYINDAKKLNIYNHKNYNINNNTIINNTNKKPYINKNSLQNRYDGFSREYKNLVKLLYAMINDINKLHTWKKEDPDTFRISDTCIAVKNLFLEIYQILSKNIFDDVQMNQFFIKKCLGLQYKICTEGFLPEKRSVNNVCCSRHITEGFCIIEDIFKDDYFVNLIIKHYDNIQKYVSFLYSNRKWYPENAKYLIENPKIRNKRRNIPDNACEETKDTNEFNKQDDLLVKEFIIHTMDINDLIKLAFTQLNLLNNQNVNQYERWIKEFLTVIILKFKNLGRFSIEQINEIKNILRSISKDSEISIGIKGLIDTLKKIFLTEDQNSKFIFKKIQKYYKTKKLHKTKKLLKNDNFSNYIGLNQTNLKNKLAINLKKSCSDLKKEKYNINNKKSQKILKNNKDINNYSFNFNDNTVSGIPVKFYEKKCTFKHICCSKDLSYILFYSKRTFLEKNNKKKLTVIEITNPCSITPDHLQITNYAKWHKTQTEKCNLYYSFDGFGFFLPTPSETYSGKQNNSMKPSIDTLLGCEAINLLHDDIKNIKYKNVVELFCGSGLWGEFALYKFKANQLTLTDIDEFSFKTIIEAKTYFDKKVRNFKCMDIKDFIKTYKHLNNKTIVVANPPYLLNLNTKVIKSNFWKENGFYKQMFDFILSNNNHDLLFIISSITFKSKKIKKLIKTYSMLLNMRIINSREVAFKWMYAGHEYGNAHQHYLAKDESINKKIEIAGMNVFVGSTKQPRTKINFNHADKRKDMISYHWHFIYSIFLSKSNNL